jgi:ABC-type antimicrobial peptide transport system permease subunit
MAGYILNSEAYMSKFNSKTITIGTAVILVLTLLYMAAPLLSVAFIAIAVFFYILSTRRVARLQPVEVSRYE